MKGRIRFFLSVLFLVIFLPAGTGLFAFGKKEEAVPEPKNTEWTLCVTAIDVSALPLSRQLTGDTVTRSLAGAFLDLDFRFRGEEESAYYRDYALAKSRAEAAKNLAAKRNERDLLLYKGDSSWRYRKGLKTVEAEIAALEAALTETEALVPVIEEKPVFRLGEANTNGTYPAPPGPGGEYRFCTEQKADAFLSGSLSEYYGRIYLSVKMYTLYTGSYSFEDSVLFSSEEMNEAIDEISIRLAAAISETVPSAVLVHAEPRDSMVLIDGSYAGQGETEARTHSPGTAEIEVHSDNHVPASFPLELNPGELSEVFVNLTPRNLVPLEVAVPGSPGSHVYLGSLYVGEAPLTLELPGTEFSYISVETPDGRIGSAVYRDNDIVRGSARFVLADDLDGGGMAEFSTKVPVSPDEKRVDRARRGFYGAYGVFWFILPAALLTGGIAGNYINSYNYMSANSYSYDYDTRSGMYDKARLGHNITVGAYCLMGAALGVTFFQIFRYLYVSREDSTPIVRVPPPAPKTPASETPALGAPLPGMPAPETSMPRTEP